MAAPRGVHGQTVEALGRRIVAGDIPEGATLDIAALRAELDVSLTALREALKVLSAKGIIDARQKRGTFVRPRADWHLLDVDVIRWHFAASAGERLCEMLHEVREIVEPAVARLAALRACAADLVALDRAIDQMAVAEGDPSAAVAADLNFHRTLLAVSHNELLQRMEVVLATGLAERDRVVHGGPHDDPVPSHRAVVDAIREGDAAGAEKAMRRLLDKSIHDERNARDAA
ncbi:FadR/GntR family transcriptional regulator [Micromonospora sp. CPCC 206061]|uniref:FadR/GntR family transcriptional regulator n=1 Tax=Micromonospora sp. CPCC 206061 TaxID=3122410 RepID=UPI002FF260D1